MNRRVVLLMSLGLAVLAVLLLQVWRNQLLQESGVSGAKVRVVAAKQDIPAFSVIETSLVEWREYPPSFLPPRAIVEEYAQDIIGMTTQYAIPAGQPVLQTDLAEMDTSVTLSRIIPENFRALSLPVDSQSTFGGLLHPKDHVDILGTFNRPQDGEVATITLLQNVVVLAVGAQLGTAASDSTGSSRRASSVVSVLVTPEEAELLIFAQDRGQLSMTMRALEDVSTDLTLPGKDFTAIFEPEVRTRIQEVRNAEPEPSVTIVSPGSRRR